MDVETALDISKFDKSAEVSDELANIHAYSVTFEVLNDERLMSETLV